MVADTLGSHVEVAEDTKPVADNKKGKEKLPSKTDLLDEVWLGVVQVWPHMVCSNCLLLTTRGERRSCHQRRIYLMRYGLAWSRYGHTWFSVA
jgi:hypothetical protein